MIACDKCGRLTKLWQYVRTDEYDPPKRWCLGCVYREGCIQDNKQYPPSAISLDNVKWQPENQMTRHKD